MVNESECDPDWKPAFTGGLAEKIIAKKITDS